MAMNWDLNPVFQTRIDPSSPEFLQNYAEMSGLVDELNERLQMALDQGDPKQIARHTKSGQLLGFLSLLGNLRSPNVMLTCFIIARDRLELLLDQDSPFLELMSLAGWGQEKVTVGGSTVGGIGLVW